MLDSAPEYLQRKLCILPQVPGKKHPCLKWKRYQNELPTDADVRDWAERWPTAGICLVLGPVSNVFAIDVDGPEAHQELIDQLGSEPIAPKVLSGSQEPFRYHLLFRYPSPLKTKPKTTPWHEHLEFRGTNGLLVLPPSVHKSGHRYEWAPGRSLSEIQLGPLPDRIVETLTTLGRSEIKEHRAQPASQSPSPIEIQLAPSTVDFLAGRYVNGPA